MIALKLTHTPFSVSSVLGLLALMGVSVETAVILVSYINKLRLENHDIRTATREAALLRLRPIMMTALVACLGLLPAALSTGIGSDTQKPFAIVIVAGLISRLFLGFFVNPVLYEMVAKRGRRAAGVRGRAGTSTRPLLSWVLLQTTLYGILHRVTITRVSVLDSVGHNDRSEDNSFAWGFAGAPRAAGLLHSRRQRLRLPQRGR